MNTYKKKTDVQPSTSSDKSTGTVFPQTDKDFSLIDSNVSPLKKTVLRAAVPNRTGLSDKLKSGVENLSGYSLDGVKVHFNSSKPAQFKAAAYTAGKNIFVAPGHESTLPHEAWHVVQQMKGEVSPTDKIDGVNVNENPLLEREADVMGKKALSQTVPSKSELIAAEPRSDIEQFSHIEDLTNPTGVIDGELKACGNATIVFECPVTDQKNYDAIYQQSLKYTDRNTICVFGINSKKPNDFKFAPATVPKGPEETQSKLTATRHRSGKRTATTPMPSSSSTSQGYSHLVYVCTFKWTEIDKTISRGYVFPAVEARQAIANAANHVTKSFGETEEEEDKSRVFVYRWLDEDSRETDTELSSLTAGIDDLANESNSAFSGGMYDWRIKEDDQQYYNPNLNTFLAKLNDAEKDLRKYYFTLAKNIAPTVPGASQLKWYIPESTLMMNQTAHDQIVGGEDVTPTGSRITAGGALASTLGKTNADQQPQDKESLRALSILRATPDNVALREKPVSKPLKVIKNDTGQVTGSYLSKEFFAALCAGGDVDTLKDKKKFYVALTNVRQSAFDPAQWCFKNDHFGNWIEEANCTTTVKLEDDPIFYSQITFNIKRKELADNLFIEYTNAFPKNAPPKKQSGKAKQQSTPPQIPQSSKQGKGPKKGKK